MLQKGSFLARLKRKLQQKRSSFLCLILMIITTSFQICQQNSKAMIGKLHQFISSKKKRVELCSACDQVWCSDKQGTDTIENELYMYISLGLLWWYRSTPYSYTISSSRYVVCGIFVNRISGKLIIFLN